MKFVENLDINHKIVPPYKRSRATNLNILTYLQLSIILDVSDEGSSYDYIYLYPKGPWKFSYIVKFEENVDITQNIVPPYKKPKLPTGTYLLAGQFPPY